ncbi:MAG: ABC transporter permease [Gordonia sp. (in: high G+C Gram-positive bacteria)]|uniref:ABC transporter permease n=1 Tax=Gordonia sp. (in: high G+C Gram-positive bacteria) TaxID=84139 RepID=UPI003C7749B9
MTTTENTIESRQLVRANVWGQVAALSARGLTKVIRNGELVFAFVAPAFLAVCFYIPLRKVMDQYPGMDYGQFLMPIIVLQSVGFAASSAAMKASFDGKDGIHTRFRVLPMPSWVPMISRLVTNAALLAVSLVCALVACLIIGWRPADGALGVLLVFAISGLIGILLALVADGIGLNAGSPQATSQAMSLPTLILGMLSTGFVPVERFPSWIQPFVRNQPISQFVDVIRGADQGALSWGLVQPSVYWCLGLFAVAMGLLAMDRRRMSA